MGLGLMDHLPWTVCANDPRIVRDCYGCPVIDLRTFGAIGKGHSPEKLTAFLVEKANEDHVEGSAADADENWTTSEA